MTKQMLSASHIVIFNDQQIRRVMHNDEWWFVIVDVVAALTESKDPNGYFRDMKRRDPELAKGGGKLPTPFRSILQAASKSLTVSFSTCA